MNGARWQLRSYTFLADKVSKDEALSVLTACILKNQESEKPVHTWADADLSDLEKYSPEGLRVSEIMKTDLFTVQKDDILDFVVEMLSWNKLRYIPVENVKGKLIGLVTSNAILQHLIKKESLEKESMITAGDIMVKKSCDDRPG